MTTRNRLLAVAVAAFVTAFVAPGSASGATDTSPPVIVSEDVVGSSSFDLTGTNVAHVVIQVHMTDDTGVTGSGCDDISACPNEPFIRVYRGATAFPSIDSLLYVLTLTSGTARDGVWEATVPVSAGSTGTWSTFVAAVDDAGNQAAQPARPATYSVTGHDAPTIKNLVFTPNVTATPTHQRSTVTGLVETADTHRPLAHATVSYGWEFECVDGEPLNTVFTDSTGQFTLSEFADPPGGCADLLEPLTTAERQAGQGPAHFSDLPLVAEVRYTLSAKVTSTTPIRVGQSTTVIGNVGNMVYWPARVLLQRWSGGAWRTVATAGVRASARYTLIATPPGPGNWRYRVVKPSDGCDPKSHRCARLGTVSATLLIGAN